MRTVSNRGSHIKWQPILQGVAVGLRVPKRDLEQRPNIGGKAQFFIMRVLQQDWNFCLLYLLQQQCLYIIKKNSPLLWLIFCECDIFSIANFSHFLKAMIHGQIIKHKKNSINQIRFKINKIHKYKLPISFLESESCILLFQAISLWRKPTWNLILEFQLEPFLCISAPA